MPIPPEFDNVRSQSKRRSQPASILNQHAKRPPELTKHKSDTSPKTKLAASIEQSSNRAIESNFQIEPSKSQHFPMGHPGGPPTGATGRHGDGKHPTQRASEYHIDISLEKCVNGFIATSWGHQTINNGSTAAPAYSKTIYISLETYANGFTAAFWRIQVINHGFALVSWRFHAINILV